MQTVLIVDDSRVFVKILDRILQKHYKVVGTASHGLEGFEKYKELKPDLVLLDITMPNCNGKECLEMIMKENPKARVVMCSSIGDDNTIQQCKDLGAKDFIRKEIISLDKNESCPPLLEIVDRVFKNEGMATTASVIKVKEAV